MTAATEIKKWVEIYREAGCKAEHRATQERLHYEIDRLQKDFDELLLALSDARHALNRFSDAVRPEGDPACECPVCTILPKLGLLLRKHREDDK